MKFYNINFLIDRRRVEKQWMKSFLWQILFKNKASQKNKKTV